MYVLKKTDIKLCAKQNGGISRHEQKKAVHYKGELQHALQKNQLL